MRASKNLLAAVALGLGIVRVAGQSPQQLPDRDSPHLLDAGRVLVAGKSTPYIIRHLPVSSFPELPAGIVELLNLRGCTIPQTYEAHHPENVVHASFAHSGSSDWAVLCSVKGSVSLLVFFDGSAIASATHDPTNKESPSEPTVLAASLETQRLQVHDTSGELGFNWGIDAASPQQVHDAQVGLQHPPARLDHDALADSVVERTTMYHFYTNLAWTVLEMPE